MVWLGRGVAMVVVVASAQIASANAGQPWSGGQLTGEPAGITDVAIAHEELVIDLRPLADEGLVAVSATYHLDNRAGAKHLDLVFATGSATRDFTVSLDGRVIASAPIADAKLPATWAAPTSTPAIGAGAGFDYRMVPEPIPFGFALDVPPGRHDLAVRYAGEAVRHRERPLVSHLFAYVLSPARSWAAFGGLDVTVHVPADWTAVVVPELARDGDMLHAAFANVPADAIAITARAPLGAYAMLETASEALLAIVALAGGFAIVIRTRSRERGRAETGQPRDTRAAAVRALVWAGAFIASGLLAVYGPALALPAHEASSTVYLAIEAIAVVLGSIVVFAVGMVVAWLAAPSRRR